VSFTELFDKISDVYNLLRVKTYCWFVKDEYGRAMLLNVAATGKRVFAYVNGNGDKWKSVTLSYRTDSGEWTEVQDSVFPYEFSIPVSEETSVFEYRMSLVDFDNIEHKGEVHILKK
jgi:hypothetical protein